MTDVNGPLRLTTCRWVNRGPAKILAHKGIQCADFPYGTDTASTWRASWADDRRIQTGLVTSVTSGLIAVDVDHPDLYATTQTAKLLGRADAMSTRADHYHVGIDARHIPRDQWPRQGPIGRGLIDGVKANGADVKANGYVAGPGSVHYSGALYEPCLDPDGSPHIVRATDEIMAALRADRDAYRAGGVSGGYDHDTAQAAIVMRGVLAGKSDAEIRAEWDLTAAHDWPDCDEPGSMGDAEFTRMVSGARRKAPKMLAEDLARADRDAAEWLKLGVDMAAILAPPVTPNGNGQAPPAAPSLLAVPDLLAGVRNGAWLNEQSFPPLHWHIDGLVPEGLTLLTGSPKIGKSWLVLGWQLDLAGRGRPVLYLALEDSNRRMQYRCRELMNGAPIPDGFGYLTEETVVPGRIVDTVAQFVVRHWDARPFVVVDTLGKAQQQIIRVKDEQAYDRDYRVASQLQATVKGCPGAGLVVCHHDRKASGEDFIDKVSGTRGVTGGPDTTLLLLRPRMGTAGILKATGRDIDTGEYAMTFDGGRWSLDGGSLEAAAGVAMQRRVMGNVGDRSAAIITFTEKHPEGVRAASVAAEFGMTPDEAGTYLTRLASSRRLWRYARGLYGTVGSVLLAASHDENRTLSTEHTQSHDGMPAEQAEILAQIRASQDGAGTDAG